MAVDRILIIGAGRIGRTIANLIQASGHQAFVTLWDKNPQLVPGQLPLASLVPPAELIFICTPSWTVRGVLDIIAPMLQPKSMVITLAKGIEAASGTTIAEVLDQVLPQHAHAVLGGPMLAEALEQGHRGVGVVGTTSPVLTSAVRDLFAHTPIEIVGPASPTDVALCGCLKNIYAFIVGMMSGVYATAEERRRGFIAARQEFLAVGAALKIPDDVLSGPAGLGDFEETATSPSSHNFHCGLDSAAHNAVVCSCEGTVSAQAIGKRLSQPQRFPLLQHLLGAINGTQPVVDLQLIGAR